METVNWWGDVEAIDGRTCRVCKTWKPLSRFSGRTNCHWTCAACVRPRLPVPTFPGVIARARGIVVTEKGHRDLMEVA